MIGSKQAMASLCLFALSCFLEAAAFAAVSPPKELPSPVEKIYIPLGYDDNDKVEMILFGYFPNSCLQTGQTSFRVDTDHHTIYVSATSYRYQNDNLFCATARIPFTQQVSLGLLPAGEYEVILLPDSKIKQNLTIVEHTTDFPDEFNYAPVDTVVIEAPTAQPENNAQPELRLMGTFPRLYVGCMKLTDVILKQESTDILVIKPIAEIFTDGPACDANAFSFDTTVRLPRPIANKTLLHVRVANGNSISRVYVKP